jgi:hypothetical protein
MISNTYPSKERNKGNKVTYATWAMLACYVCYLFYEGIYRGSFLQVRTGGGLNRLPSIPRAGEAFMLMYF